MPDLARNPTKKRMTREIVPFSSADFRMGSVAMVENPDPVLQHIAFKGEEEWRTMERACAAVSIAKKKRVNTLLSYGSEIQAGSNSKEAKDLQQWAIQLYKRIDKLSIVHRRKLDAIFWGWRPLEAILDFGFKYKGKSFWGVKNIYEKMPEDFRFTVDRELVYVGNGYQDPIVFDKPEDKYHWLVCSAGSTNNPYGEAEYREVWFAYYIGQRFLQLWGQGMGRSVGTMKVKEGASMLGGMIEGNAKTIPEIAREVSDVIRTLNERGVLIERSGWSVELLKDIRFSEAWSGPMDYIDNMIRLILTGETLTSSTGGEGSRAASEVARSGLIDYCKSDAKCLESWENDDFLAPLVRLNHGEDVPDEDMPKWRSKIGQVVDVVKAQALFEMGAPLDGKKIAADAGVPLITDPTDDDIVLQKVEPIDPFAAGEDPNAEPHPSGPPSKKPRRPVPVSNTPKQAPASTKPDKRDADQLTIFPVGVVEV